MQKLLSQHVTLPSRVGFVAVVTSCSPNLRPHTLMFISKTEIRAQFETSGYDDRTVANTYTEQVHIREDPSSVPKLRHDVQSVPSHMTILVPEASDTSAVFHAKISFCGANHRPELLIGKTRL